TFTIPGTQPGDPQGLYYLEISGDGDYCGSAGAASYTIEPEPSTQYTKPMLLPGGPNMKAAGGPLAGHVTYGASLSNARQDWTYFTSNGSHTVTARIENTTDSQDGCQEVSVALENANGSTVDSATLADEGAAKIVISLSGTFYLKLTADGCTPTPNAPLTADIILTPASGMNGPVLTVSGTTLAKATAGTAYSSAIGVTGGTGPYTFRPETALPPGLSLNDQTGAISGTPAKPGTYNFMIEITDSAQPAPNSITERFHLAVS
ncbi:MAG TPA: Ig domain-containing protein, partial [Pseudonocardiaceae bacterium]|nr:Ig domain-containing protein [Pseudonocardiaceae bacterium]